MLEFCVNQIIPIFRLSGFMTRQWRNRQPMMHRLGIFALMVLFVLQAIVVTSAPRVAPGADNETIVVCTGNGMKVMSLSDLGVDSVDDLDPNDPRHLASGDHCALCAVRVRASRAAIALCCICPSRRLGLARFANPGRPRA